MKRVLSCVISLCILAPVSQAQQPERPWFRDATKEYGPIGGGAPALVDLDGDGFPDLICNGRIYQNDAGKRFVEVTKDSGAGGSGKACVADIDNDGRPDLYFCGSSLRRPSSKTAAWNSAPPANGGQRSSTATACRSALGRRRHQHAPREDQSVDCTAEGVAAQNHGAPNHRSS